MTLEIKNIEDIDSFQRLTMTEFSYSRIDTYEMCPSKYFFSYIKKEPKKYIDLANDPTLKFKGVARTAVDRGYLVFDKYRLQLGI